ncbi:MAG: hypothetical protein O3A00_00325 [Planctomycetota bacterium]|nr:hypothetical protein [Planctomycetota bacterium]
MHGKELTEHVVFGLGWIYLILVVMNAAWTVRSYKSRRHFELPEVFGGAEVPTAGIWAAYTAILMMIATAHFTGASNPDDFLLTMPDVIRNWINLMANPVSFFAASTGLFCLMIMFRRWLVQDHIGWLLLNASLVFTALSMTDYDFRQIVGKPDNVPIVAMLFIVGFFTWLYFKKAVENDDRIDQGRPLLEQENNEKVLVWPDLVYTELICMVVVTAGLVLWGIALQAPLEEPASSVKTPNPSKAPWYFLGLQEMLVYFDPWLAGVVLPSIILVGLMAIPYIDFNKLGNGYYTFNQRKFAVITFMFGFLPLWVAMIILGTFLRGPNWNFFGIYEFWDVHKLEALNNVNLSEYLWVYSPLNSMFGGLPTAPAGAGALEGAGYIFLREGLGIVLVLMYFFALPPILAGTVFRRFYLRMGFLRFMVLANLALWMASLPIKMVLRWSVNMKYIVAIPEYFFNI